MSVSEKMDALDLRREFEVAKTVAASAGAFIADHWNRPVKLQHKGAVDLVTEVDLGAERIIVDALSRAFPTDTIVAEEGSSDAKAASRTWYVDPLDGTTNFSHGVPHFAVSIGLLIDGRPVVGVIYEPIRKWCFAAATGHGAWLNDTALNVSPTVDLNQSLLATGFPYDRWHAEDNNIHRCAHLIRQAQGLRRAGAAALDLAYVAAGWLDGYWEIKLSSWDVAAGWCLVQEAGGRVTGFDGSPMDIKIHDLVATNGRIHESLVASLGASEHTKQA